MVRQARRQREWQGEWIWGIAGVANGQTNTYSYFRRTFELTSDPVKADVRLTADSRYQLFVNGKRVCRGPARCIPKYQAYDEIDLAPYLKRGKNCIAVIAHHFGVSTFQSLERGGRGFLLDGEVVCKRGKPLRIDTHHRHWKTLEAKAYRRDTARLTIQLGFQEDFDANKHIGDWTKINFDDSSWHQARYAGSAAVMPFESFEPSGIPFEYEKSARFASHTGVFVGTAPAGYQTACDIGALIADEKHKPAKEAVIQNIDAAFKRRGGHMTVQPTTGKRFHSVVVDAGKETCGFVEFDIEARGGEIVDFFFCEHVRPDGTAITRAESGCLASIANRYHCRKGLQKHRFFAWQGFRYVLIVFRDVAKPLKVHHLGYTFTGYPVERQGSFECSDSLLNRIWETGVYTQELCMHDAYMDCPWREQAQWWGDARIQWQVNMAAFGDQALFKRGIRQIAQSQTFDGLTYGLSPCEEHGCILPDYTLVWVCSIYDYFLYTGDDEPIREHYDRIVKAMAYFERFTTKDNLLQGPGPGWWLFLDWAPLFKGGYNATYNLQYVEALQITAKIARHLKRNKDAARYQQLADKLQRKIARSFWDTQGKQVFEGCWKDTMKVHRQVSQHANAYAILTGTQKKHHGAIADRIAWIQQNFDRLAPDNTGGNLHTDKSHYPIASSFFYAYVLQAMFDAGRGQDALDGIRSLWGKMLDNGATTWYESWNHGPATYGESSACHAWSASPTYHLSQQVGGITPASPGFDTIRIAPRMYDLDWAETTVPTRHGMVSVSWQRDGEAMNLSVKVPKHAKAILDLPGRKPRTVGSGPHNFTTG